jgi:hypothetical protein
MSPCSKKEVSYKNLVTQAFQKIGIKTTANLTYQGYHNMLSRNSRLILLLQNSMTEMATDTIFGAMLTKIATRM